MPEIAKIVGKSDRTIRRYRAKIRARNALAPSPTFTRELVGDTVQRAYQSHSHLVQIAHDKSVSPRDRAFAAREAWKTWRDLIPLLKGLGYLSTEIAEDKSASHGDAGVGQSPDDLIEQIKDLRRVGGAKALPSEWLAVCAELASLRPEE